MRDAYAPLVWQCRYSGIEVPDELWRYVEFGKGKKYSDNQAEHIAAEADVSSGVRRLDRCVRGVRGGRKAGCRRASTARTATGGPGTAGRT